MTTRLSVACLFAIACGVLLLVPGAFDALFALVFIGMVPFSDYIIPPMPLLAAYALFIALLIRWLFVQPIFMPDTKRRDAAERATARKRVLKKTAHQTTTDKPKKHRRYTLVGNKQPAEIR